MDVIEGRGPSPYLVLLDVQRLPDDSLTSALANGGRQFFGWGQTRYMLADIFDAVNTNTRATGNWAKGKVPKIPEYPRPKKKTPDAPRKGAVKSLFNRMHGGK